MPPLPVPQCQDQQPVLQNNKKKTQVRMKKLSKPHTEAFLVINFKPHIQMHNSSIRTSWPLQWSHLHWTLRSFLLYFFSPACQPGITGWASLGHLAFIKHVTSVTQSFVLWLVSCCRLQSWSLKKGKKKKPKLSQTWLSKYSSQEGTESLSLPTVPQQQEEKHHLG